MAGLLKSLFRGKNKTSPPEEDKSSDLLAGNRLVNSTNKRMLYDSIMVKNHIMNKYVINKKTMMSNQAVMGTKKIIEI